MLVGFFYKSFLYYSHSYFYQKSGKSSWIVEENTLIKKARYIFRYF